VSEQHPPPHDTPYGHAPGAPPPPGYGQPHDGPPPPGYGPAPYDPRWGYGPPGVHTGPSTHITSDDTTWGLMSYVLSLVAGLLAPLVIYFVKRRHSAFVRHHAAQALNYQLTVLIQIVVVVAVCVPVAVIAGTSAALIPVILVWVFQMVAQWVFLVLGAIQAGKARYYRFPTFFCYPMVR
jgi:uncharacterized Tic20 family protein